MSKVSVVILITKNDCLDFFEECLKSIYNQVVSPYEVVLVLMGIERIPYYYNGMTLEEKKVWTNKVKPFYLDDILSVSKASNFGIDKAKGDFVLRVDPDDKLDENYLSIVLPYLESGKYDAVYPDSYQINEIGSITDYGSKEVSFELNPLDAGVIYNKEKFIAIGGYDENLEYQVSYDLMQRFCKGNRVKQVKLPLYHYRKHKGNMSKATDKILYARRLIEGRKDYVLCVIPARGGSKGIPLKNLYKINGKPLMEYCIEAAKGSKLINEILVSTDSPSIYEAAIFLGVNAVYRPKELATDEVSIISVAKYHAENNEQKPSVVVCLQPTSPLVTADDLDSGIIKILGTGCDSVVSVYKVSHNHPVRVMRRVKDRLFPYSDSYDERILDRKSFPPCYAYNGAFFIRKTELLLNWNGKDFGLGRDVRALEMPEERSINVDTSYDLLLVELLLKEKFHGN